ncbi:hypothetical protein AURDEDRAFT_66169 [Auricularia subglabra TFB-10046 SS5]|nr:hypothetical protein AURDEDRAFT_66169 [Auricularia subglabra TFB-10046 SS5]
MSVYALRIHHGAVDQGTVTTGSPPDVFAHVTSVLLSMGVEFHKETEFKYRCVRPKRRKVSAQPPPSPHKDVAGPQGVAAYTMDGVRSTTSASRSVMGPQPLPTAGGANQDPLYGDRSQDLCDEVRFSVELTRIDRLDDTLSLDIRRLKGNLRSYKFLYDTLRECVLPSK